MKRIIFVLLAVLLILPLWSPPALAAPTVQEGNCLFFTETVEGSDGYFVCDDDNARFLSAFENWGLQKIGYPISQRYTRDGFVTQAFQKAIMQWRSDTGSVSLVNIFDDLHNDGFDETLLETRQVPSQLPPGWDGDLSFDEVVEKRQALLEVRPALQATYFASSNPLTFYGLPTSEVQDMGNHYAIRTQRTVLQEWKEDVPWAKTGEVTIANGADIAKELGALPVEALRGQASDSDSTNSNPDPDTSGNYILIQDSQNLLEVEIPISWGEQEEGTWVDDEGQDIGIYIAAAPNLENYFDTWTTPGIFFGASRALAQRMTEVEFANSIDFSEACNYEGRNPYEGSRYTGVGDVWSNCGGTDTTLMVLSLTPPDRSFIAMLEIIIASEDDLDALQHILGSFSIADELPEVASAGSAGSAGSASTAPSEAPSGTILFTSNRSSYDDCYSMNADGSNVRQLTTFGFCYDAHFTSDGKQIVFSHQESEDAPFDVWIMNVDGTNPTNLTNTSDHDEAFPVVSPDGQKIAYLFTWPGGFEIYTMNLDGSDRQPITSRNLDWMPTWSPNGQQVAFSSLRDDSFNIWVVNRDGSGLRQVTNFGTDRIAISPLFSPDGQQIAFSTIGIGTGWEIWTVNLDGSNPQALMGTVGREQKHSTILAGWHDDKFLIGGYEGNWDPYIVDAANREILRIPVSDKDDKPTDWRP